MTGRRRLLCGPLLCGFLALAGLACGAAAEEANPVLHFNQAYLEEAMRTSTLDVNDPMAVFAFVFAGLPERVKVYPTENYFYFTFIHNGAPYDGNIRLDASNRDDGKMHLRLFGGPGGLAQRNRRDPPHSRRVVRRERREGRALALSRSPIGTRASCSSSTISRGCEPPPIGAGAERDVHRPDLRRVGGPLPSRVQPQAQDLPLHARRDRAGRRPARCGPERTDRILIGKRTGFAFYRDHLLDRKILIGVLRRQLA